MSWLLLYISTAKSWTHDAVHSDQSSWKQIWYHDRDKMFDDAFGSQTLRYTKLDGISDGSSREIIFIKLNLLSHS